jgi:tRNA threonylcarbamoyladenosine biosynthesis protein TsaB
MLLALDTSTSLASVALVASAADAAEARLVAEVTWQVGQRHSTELLERIEWLLAASGVTMADLTGVAVALGPGSFNGLRVALATAKSLAFARDVPLVGVPTLDVIGWGYRAVAGTICATLEAGRGQVYAALYDGHDTPQPDAATWSPRNGYAILTVAELSVKFDGDAYFCGELAPATRATLAETAGGKRFRIASALETRRASWLAELALARMASQRYDDAMALEPLYLRRPAITASARRGVAAPESETSDRHDTGGR